MTETWNARLGPESETGQEQAGRPGASVTDEVACDRARRRWRLHQVGGRRRISVALDQRCGIEIPEPGTVQIDYTATGLDLGFVERRAAGLELFAAERAA